MPTAVAISEGRIHCLEHTRLIDFLIVLSIFIALLHYLDAEEALEIAINKILTLFSIQQTEKDT